jgi:hypothetical protein
MLYLKLVSNPIKNMKKLFLIDFQLKVMWERFKKAGFLVSILAILVFILKVVFKGGHFEK